MHFLPVSKLWPHGVGVGVGWGQVPTQITNCCIPTRPPTPYEMHAKYNATMIATMFSEYSDCGCGVVDVDDDQQGGYHGHVEVQDHDDVERDIDGGLMMVNV